MSPKQWLCMLMGFANRGAGLLELATAMVEERREMMAQSAAEDAPASLAEPSKEAEIVQDEVRPPQPATRALCQAPSWCHSLPAVTVLLMHAIVCHRNHRFPLHFYCDVGG